MASDSGDRRCDHRRLGALTLPWHAAVLVDSFWRPPSYTVNYAVQFFSPLYSVDLAMALLLGAVTVGAMAWSFVRVAPRSDCCPSAAD